MKQHRDAMVTTDSRQQLPPPAWWRVMKLPERGLLFDSTGQSRVAVVHGGRAGNARVGSYAEAAWEEAGDMSTARELMHVGAQCIGEGDSLTDAARMMRDLDVGSLPICGRDDKLHGIITDRDIVVKCLAEGRDPSSLTAGELAQGTVVYCDADADENEVMRLMEQHHIRRLPVIENHRLVGMISEIDIARVMPEEKIADWVEKVYAAR